ncbi:hypothetical protein ACOSP7_005759 [Xanthoceras sorbifolium]|uniref:Eukaryotic translation initiation factor 4B3 n=1 Tax=Xanthoceras sorbifolium TaxID=99658 RepID=A0ABQ8IE02_9ROSI|nr:hypothetical protein JRO89_XS02G0022100 [Xanthoceras sorbifolium]
MAATVSSPWSKPGAWALDAEEHEAELQEQQEEQQKSSEIADFPSLAAAAATKTKKKSKGQTLSLAEFNSGKPRQPTQPKGLTHEDLLVLPTGPRERSAEELDRSRLGGGFKNYGSNSRYGSSGQNGDESSNSRWSSSRVSGRDASRELQPSRADEIDNWAAGKKPVSSLREKGGFFESHSKADESDSWVSNKTTEARGRFGFGGFERKSSFDSLSKEKERDRDNWGRKREESGASGESERPRPRLVLQPRTVPVTSTDGPASAVAKTKGSNPFGEARPREDVLAEKGKDWKEIDEKLEAVKIKEERPEVPERASSFGRRGFGNGNDRTVETRSWRKSDSDSTEATAPQSAWKTGNAWKTENGHAERKSENGDAEEKSENGHVEEN